MSLHLSSISLVLFVYDVRQRDNERQGDIDRERGMELREGREGEGRGGEGRGGEGRGGGGGRRDGGR